MTLWDACSSCAGRLVACQALDLAANWMSESGLQIEVLSTQDVRKRAREPQMSGLSSLLSSGLNRTVSLPCSSSAAPSSFLNKGR